MGGGYSVSRLGLGKLYPSAVNLTGLFALERSWAKDWGLPRG